jgi:hypothetical protein
MTDPVPARPRPHRRPARLAWQREAVPTSCLTSTCTPGRAFQDDPTRPNLARLAAIFLKIMTAAN